MDHPLRPVVGPATGLSYRIVTMSVGRSVPLLQDSHKHADEYAEMEAEIQRRWEAEHVQIRITAPSVSDIAAYCRLITDRVNGDGNAIAVRLSVFPL